MIFSEHRRRKAPLVWRIIESAVLRSDGGRQALNRLLARLLPSPHQAVDGASDAGASASAIPERAGASVPLGAKSEAPLWPAAANGRATPPPPSLGAIAAAPPPSARITSAKGLLEACLEVGCRLGASFSSEWIRSAKPVPTLRANFAFNQVSRTRTRVALRLRAPPWS